MDLADIALVKSAQDQDDADDKETLKFIFPNESTVTKCKVEIDVSASDCFVRLRNELLKGYIDAELNREFDLTRLAQFILVNNGYDSIPLKGISTTSQLQYFMRMWNSQKGQRWEQKMTVLFESLVAMIDEDNPEGARGLWELSVRDECLPFFTDDVLAALIDCFEESEHEEVHWCAAGAIWCLCRHFHVLGGLVSSGCVDAMVKRVSTWDPNHPPENCADTFSGAFSMLLQNTDAQDDMTNPERAFTGTHALLILCSKNREAAEALCNCLPGTHKFNITMANAYTSLCNPVI